MEEKEILNQVSINDVKSVVYSLKESELKKTKVALEASKEPKEQTSLDEK